MSFLLNKLKTAESVLKRRRRNTPSVEFLS